MSERKDAALKIPDVRKVGTATIEGVRFVLFMIREDWEPDDPEHDSDHARGQCPCPYYPPLFAIERAAEEAR